MFWNPFNCYTHYLPLPLPQPRSDNVINGSGECSFLSLESNWIQQFSVNGGISRGFIDRWCVCVLGSEMKIARHPDESHEIKGRHWLTTKLCLFVFVISDIFGWQFWCWRTINRKIVSGRVTCVVDRWFFGVNHSNDINWFVGDHGHRHSDCELKLKFEFLIKMSVQ